MTRDVEPPRGKLGKGIATFTAGVVVGVGGTIGVYHLLPKPDSIPGGVWETPGNGQTVARRIHFAAQAYPTRPGDPPIDYVNFTASVGGTWQIACRDDTPAQPPAPPEYSCDWEVPSLVKPGEKIIVSFDVYDRNGNSNKAPNGLHEVTEAE